MASDDNENQEDKPKRRVVVTHYGKKKKEDEEIPSEIMPHEPTHVLSSPVDIEQASSAPQEPEIKPQPSIKEPEPEPARPYATSRPSIDIPLRESPTSFDEPPIYAHASHSVHGDNMPPPGNDSSMQTEEPSGRERSGGSGFSAFFSLLMLLAVAVLAYFAYHTQTKLNQLEQLGSTHKENALALSQQAKLSLDKLNEKQKEEQQSQKELAKLKSDVLSAQSQLVNLKKDSDWALAEANYMAFMANQRLKWAYDVPTALIQLQAADDRLRNAANPALGWVRDAIAKDIAQLKNLPEINRQVIWEQIQNISNSFYQLHFKRLDDALKDPNTLPKDLDKLPAWRQALVRSWYEFKGLIRVTHQDKNSVPMALSLQEESQVMRTMQLLCQQAQWAVLEGQNVIYQNSLKSLENSLSQYFDDTQIQTAMLKQVRDLAAVNIAVQSPDISKSIQALSQAIRQNGDKL